MEYSRKISKRLSSPKLSLAERTYKELEHQIVFCEIEPKSILTESELSELLKASRTPIREALKKLASEGLVEISKSGILVPDISVSTQLKLLKVRRVIEKLCVECAVENASVKDIETINNIVSNVEKISDDVLFLDYLRQMHKALSLAAKNEFVTKALNSVQGLSRRFWFYYAKKEDYAIAKNLHKDILIHIVNRDLEQALNSSSKLVDYLEDFAIKRLP